MGSRGHSRDSGARLSTVETRKKEMSNAVLTYFIVTKVRQGGRMYRKMNGRWTRNRFHTMLAIYHNRGAADMVALSENATVLEV